MTAATCFCMGCSARWPVVLLAVDGKPRDVVQAHARPADGLLSPCAVPPRLCPACLRSDCPTYEGAL